MSDWALIFVAAAFTYLSRVSALALLPPARGRFLVFVERLPAPLFAGLAVFALVGDRVTLPDAPSLAAAAGALLAAPRRSLGLTLAAGLAAFALVEWLL